MSSSTVQVHATCASYGHGRLHVQRVSARDLLTGTGGTRVSADIVELPLVITPLHLSPEHFIDLLLHSIFSNTYPVMFFFFFFVPFVTGAMLLLCCYYAACFPNTVCAATTQK